MAITHNERVGKALTFFGREPDFGVISVYYDFSKSLD